MKIALISDIHFGKDSKTKEFSVPFEKIEDETAGAVSLEQGVINLLKQYSVEYLFIAGDLTSQGSPQEYFYCEKKILEIANTCGIPQNNIVCCFGNHDIDWNISNLYELHCKDANLDKNDIQIIKNGYKQISAFAPYVNLKKLRKHNETLSIPNVYVQLSPSFIVFVLNTSWDCGPGQEISHGNLSINQIKWFENEAKKYSNDNRYKIVLMHHHPFQYPYPVHYFDSSEIEDGAEFLNVVAKYGINLILHGHRHHPITKTLQLDGSSTPTVFLCAGSLSANSKLLNEVPNTIHIIDLDADKKVIDLYNYEYSIAEGWVPVKQAKVKPLDDKMHLGKIISDKELDELVMNCVKSSRRIWKWQDLPEEVHFRLYSDVNDSFKKAIDNAGYIMIGTFPDHVAIVSDAEVNQ